VREAIASALEARGWIEGAVVLDMFAGTGALALEALSRGAVRAVCVDRDAKLVRAIVDAGRELGAEIEAVAIDLSRPGWIERLPGGRFSLVFFDPPYDQIALVPPLLSTLRDGDRLERGAAIVIEHGKKSAVDLPSGFREVASYRYGDTAVLLSMEQA
jgi:16S rRNA (guanine966-N2)-methyltransferase